MSNQKRMCAKCAVDPVLIETVEEEGKRGQCSVCGERRKTAPVDGLAERILPAYHKFVKPAEDIPDPDDDSDNLHLIQDGRSPNEILQDLVGCEPEAADVLLKALSDLDWRSVKDGGDDLFSVEQYGYDLEAPRSDVYERRWRAFERSVKHEARFFNAAQRRFLEDLFTPLLRGDLSEGRPPLVTIGSQGSLLTRVFRAREANDATQRGRIYEHPARELGAPPRHLWRQGRMNAPGIGVFYGSSDSRTAVAELRRAGRRYGGGRRVHLFAARDGARSA